MKKTAKKTQATHTASLVTGLPIKRQELFADVAERLAHAMADMHEHHACPEYLRVKIAELHNSLMDEFRVEIAHDIRLRFALAAKYAADGNRPA